MAHWHTSANVSDFTAGKGHQMEEVVQGPHRKHTRFTAFAPTGFLNLSICVFFLDCLISFRAQLFVWAKGLKFKWLTCQVLSRQS